MPRRSANPDEHRFDEWLNKKLEARNIDLQKLCRDAEVSAAYISMLRRRLRRPSLKVVVRLARALNAANEIDVALAAAGLQPHASEALIQPSSNLAQTHVVPPTFRAPARSAAWLDREWLAVTLSDYATVCDCTLVFVPAVGDALIASSETVFGTPTAFTHWFQKCLTGSHPEMRQKDLAAGHRATTIVTSCTNGLSHLVRHVFLPGTGTVIGTLHTSAVRTETFQIRACFDQARAAGYAEEYAAFERQAVEHLKAVDEPGLTALSTMIRLLAQTIERAASEKERGSQIAIEQAAAEEIAASLSPRMSVDELLCKILDGVDRLIPFSYGNITEVDWTRRQIRVLVSKIPGRPAMPGSSDYSPQQWSIDEGVTGWVALRSRPRRLSDVGQEPRFIRNWPPSQSELAVPLVLDGVVIGVLNLESEELAHFTEHHEQLLTMVAAHVATGVGRARLRKQELQWRERFSGLARLHRAVLERGDEASLLEELARRIVALEDFRMCVIRTNDEQKGHLLLGGIAHADHVVDAKDIGYKLPYLSLSGRAIQANQTLITHDVQNDERFRRPDLARALGLHGMIAVPIPSLAWKEPPAGCINVYTVRSGEDFDDDVKRLLEDIAGFVAVAYSNLKATLRLVASTHGINALPNFAASESLDRMCGFVADQISAQAVSIFLVQDGALHLEGTTGMYNVNHPDDYVHVVIPIGQGKTGWVAKRGLPMRLAERTEDDELQCYAGAYEAHAWVERDDRASRDGRSEVEGQRVALMKKRPFLAVPITRANEIVGVIRAVGKQPDRAFTALDQQLLEIFARGLGDHLRHRHGRAR
jgi:GAF domain-containing protein/transcriptional regulator with XRE-family HTH domain